GMKKRITGKSLLVLFDHALGQPLVRPMGGCCQVPTSVLLRLRLLTTRDMNLDEAAESFRRDTSTITTFDILFQIRDRDIRFSGCGVNTSHQEEGVTCLSRSGVAPA